MILYYYCYHNYFILYGHMQGQRHVFGGERRVNTVKTLKFENGVGVHDPPPIPQLLW